MSAQECRARYRAKLRRSPEEYRQRRREEARRRRAKLYAAGLTSTGAPIQRPDISNARRVYADHPAGCPCHDCLFPPVEYQPTVYRAGVQA